MLNYGQRRVGRMSIAWVLFKMFRKSDSRAEAQHKPETSVAAPHSSFSKSAYLFWHHKEYLFQSREAKTFPLRLAAE